MSQPKFESGDYVKIKGSSRAFTVQSVYCLLECPDRALGYYYSGEFFEDVHESKLDIVKGSAISREKLPATTNKSKFSDNLKFLMKKNEVTFTQLALGSGVSRSSCYDAAYRSTPTKMSTIVNIANFFKVKIDDILFSEMSDGSTN